jgi:hypothetical protein
MDRNKIYTGVFTTLAIALFCVNGLSGAESLPAWAMLIISNIYASKID